MKRIVSLLICLCMVLPVLAVQRPGQLPRTVNSFALLDDYVGGSYEGINNRYLMPKMVQGKSIRVAINWGKFSALSREDMQYIVARVYKKWFLQTAEQIRKAKRSAEFADILPLLDKGVEVEFVTQDPDIEIRFVPLLEGIRKGDEKDTTLGYYTQHNVLIPTIFVPEDWEAQKGNSKDPKKLAKFYATLLIHEIGHSIGLADTYEGGRLASDQLYSTVKIYPSVMDSVHHAYKEENLSCDDATGIINLIDITRNYTARGGEKGWHSLCSKSKEYFIHNISGARGLYKVELDDDRNVVISKAEKQQVTHHKYPRASQMYTPMDNLVLVKPKEYDGLKRVVRGETANGEEVFINYLYESRKVAVVRNGKLMYYRQDWQPERGKRKTWWVFQRGNRIQTWNLEIRKKTRELSIFDGNYRTQNGWKAAEKIYRKYDNKGKLQEAKNSYAINKPKPDGTAAQKAPDKAQGTKLVSAQALNEQINIARLDQFVKEFKFNTKAKDGKIAL